MNRTVLGRTRVIAIWGVPRSVSTAFEKTFTRLPGLRIVHEPFADCYYFGPQRRSERYGEVVEPEVYDQRCTLDRLEPAVGETVVFKDLCFQAAHYVPDNFLAKITNTFIVRHPDLVVDSLLKLKPNFTQEELGFDSLSDMFERVRQLGQEPTVVEGQVFRAEPELVLRRFCSEVEIPFQSNMLEWDDGRIRQWAPHETKSQAQWHSMLEASKQIEPPQPVRPSPPVSLGHVYERALATYYRVAAHAVLPASKKVA